MLPPLTLCNQEHCGNGNKPQGAKAEQLPKSKKNPCYELHHLYTSWNHGNIAPGCVRHTVIVVLPGKMKLNSEHYHKIVWAAAITWICGLLFLPWAQPVSWPCCLPCLPGRDVPRSRFGAFGLIVFARV